MFAANKVNLLSVYDVNSHGGFECQPMGHWEAPAPRHTQRFVALLHYAAVCRSDPQFRVSETKFVSQLATKLIARERQNLKLENVGQKADLEML
jgi:hypothetical protein